MAENYKHLYEQMKKMVTMYQDELIPGFRKQIEELEAKTKWIPVTERLPEKWQNVLTVSKNGSIDFDYICSSGGWYGDLENQQNPVTHWRPMPETPKEVE